MIDQALIREITKTIQTSLINAKKINDQLSFIQNVLPLNCITKIENLLKSELSWKTVPYQEKLNRKMIDWIPESIVEEIHLVGDMLTRDIKEYYSIDNIELQAFQLWKDTPGYTLDLHQDNPVIDVAMQIYLDGNSDEGTSFVIDKKEIKLPLKKNTGYLLWKKSNNERILHGTTKEISSGERITLYLTWSRFGKQAPDADDPAAFL